MTTDNTKKMTLADLGKMLEWLGAPDQGLEYTGGGFHRGDWKYDPYTGEERSPKYSPSELTVYGDRADAILRLIHDSEHLAARLATLLASESQT